MTSAASRTVASIDITRTEREAVMETRREPWLARHAPSAVVILAPLSCAPLLVLPYATPAQAFSIVGICTAVMAFLSAMFRLAGHIPDRRHLDLIGKQMSAAAAFLGLCTAIIAYYLVDQLTGGG